MINNLKGIKKEIKDSKWWILLFLFFGCYYTKEMIDNNDLLYLFGWFPFVCLMLSTLFKKRKHSEIYYTVTHILEYIIFSGMIIYGSLILMYDIPCVPFLNGIDFVIVGIGALLYKLYCDYNKSRKNK